MDKLLALLALLGLGVSFILPWVLSRRLFFASHRSEHVKRQATVDQMVMTQNGLSADEIKRLKHLTPEERAKLMASLKKPPIKKPLARQNSGLLEDIDQYNGDANQYRLFDP